MSRNEGETVIKAIKQWCKNLYEQGYTRTPEINDSFLKLLGEMLVEDESPKPLKIELPEPPKEFKVVIDGMTRLLRPYVEGQAMSPNCRVVSFLTSPVGSDKSDPLPTPSQDAQTSPSPASASDIEDIEAYRAHCRNLMTAPPPKSKPDAHSNGLAYETLTTLDEEWRKSFHRHSMVHGSVLKGKYWGIFTDGYMRPLENYTYWDHAVPQLVYYAETDQAWSKGDFIDKSKAAETFRMLSAESKKLFKRNEHTGLSVYPDGMTNGQKVQVITTNGQIMTGPASSFYWSSGVTVDPVVKYYRKL